MCDVILNDEGRNSVKQNAIVHDNSTRALLRHQERLHSTDVANKRLPKDLSCDALIIQYLYLAKINPILRNCDIAQ